MAAIVTIEFVKSGADCCLKDGEQHKPQLDSKVSVSKEDLISEPRLQTKSVWRRRLEIIVLTCIILAVCALFVTPTILYALPPLSVIRMVSLVLEICTSQLHNSSYSCKFQSFRAHLMMDKK